jgi:chaperonin GroEL (HSP60 family)
LQVGKGKVVKVTGVANPGRTATVLLRGSNKMVLEEADRSLHDALCVIRCLVNKRFLIAGGSAPEVEITQQLSKWAKTLQVRGTSARAGCLLCQLRAFSCRVGGVGAMGGTWSTFTVAAPSGYWCRRR